MKRIFGIRPAALLAAALMLAFVPFLCGAEAAMVQDPEVHRVVGGLCSLAAAVNLHCAEEGTDPEPGRLAGYFTGPTVSEWIASARVTAAGGSWWVGLPVDRYSSVRPFLRAHATELGVTGAPGAGAWMGGAMAWMEATDVSARGKDRKADRAAPLSAAPGADGQGIFWSLGGSWWMGTPAMTEAARAAALKRWGVQDAPALSAPEGEARRSEEFKASPVPLPEDMHVGREQSNDYSIEMGDVIFNPIPTMKDN